MIPMTSESPRRVVFLARLSIVIALAVAAFAARLAQAQERPRRESVAAIGFEKPPSDRPLRNEQLNDPRVGRNRPGDWNQWGGSPWRNNTPEGKNILIDWKVGEFDDNSGSWKRETSRNIKGVARLGTKSHGNPVVANGKVFIGANNGSGYLHR